jgi:hypothetical protein
MKGSKLSFKSAALCHILGHHGQDGMKFLPSQYEVYFHHRDGTLLSLKIPKALWFKLGDCERQKLTTLPLNILTPTPEGVRR